jgi:outer membrane autotransporter protein
VIQSALSRPLLALPTHRRLIPHLMAGLSAVAFTLAAPEASATDTVWTGGNGEFFTGSNWTGGVVPTGSTGPATFGDVLARTVTITLAPGTTGGVGVLQFNAGAGPFTFNLGAGAGSIFVIAGSSSGIINNSAYAPTFNVQAGGTALYFSGSSSAGDAVINNQGRVVVQGSSSAGTATINTTNGGDVWFTGNGVAGSAVLNATDSTIRFDSGAFAQNATITLNGTSVLRFFGGGASLGAASITANSGTMVEITGYTFGGTASLDIRSGATLEMQTSVNPTLAFGSLIAGGMVNIGSINLAVGSLSGSGTIDTASAGGPTITVGGGNESSAFSGTITGNTLGLVKNGTGTFTFGGTMATSGLTQVNAGTLQVDGSIGGTGGVSVGSGGTLAGAGTVSGLSVASGGFVAPGSGGIGTLNVTGNATLSAGSTTVIEVSAASADKLAISGTASLAGGLRLVTVGTGFSFGTNYTILSAAGGLTGTFNPVNIVGSFGPGIGTSLSYTGTEAILSLSANALLPLLPPGIVTNPRNVAGGIDRAVAGGADASAFFGLYALNPAAMPGALSALSGEAATGTQQTAFNAAGLFLSMMLDPMTGARGATATSASPSLVQMADPPAGGRAIAVDAGWNVWTKAYAQSGAASGDAAVGSASTTGSLYGVAAGADKRLSPDMLVGFALSGGGTSFGLGQARGSGTGDTFQAGLYGSTRLGQGYVSAALAYGWNSFSISRSVAAAGLNETYGSRVTAQTFGGRIEAGWRMGVRAYGLTPYAALEAIGYQAPGYGETFTAPVTGAFALRYAGKTSASIRSELGLRADARTELAPGQTLITYGRLAWAYQARPDRSIDASFQGLANSGFTVFGARASMHTALASLGAELQLAAGTRLSSSIDAELGDRHRSIRANLGLRHSW